MPDKGQAYLVPEDALCSTRVGIAPSPLVGEGWGEGDSPTSHILAEAQYTHWARGVGGARSGPLDYPVIPPLSRNPESAN